MTVGRAHHLFRLPQKPESLESDRQTSPSDRVPGHFAYVLVGYASSSEMAVMAERPRFEYELMLQRHPTALFDLRRVEAEASTFTRRLLRDNRRGLAIAHHVLTRHRYEAILASGEDVGLPLGLLASRGLRRPRIYIITHGSYFGSPNFRRFMRVFRHARHIHYLCLSEALRQILINEFGVDADRAHNVGYAADTDFYESAEMLPDPCQVVSAGAANRDYPTLIAAASQLKVNVTIACGSTWFNNLPRQLGDDLPSNVTARPHSYSELRDLYARSAFVVVPLRTGKHACGYAVIADAMASGRAVIASRTEAYSDFIVEGETGLYARCGDVDDLREKMAYLLANPEEARRMGRCARARMEQLYTLDSFCCRMENLIASTVKCR